MQLTRYKLGDLIVQRREKNKNFDVPIRGVSKEGFIKPKQQEADTSIYNVFYKKDFVFNPARMELNSIALNLEFDKALCSSLYEVFYIKDENVLLPEFLNLHIKRDEFARHCEYIGSGSAREYCRFAHISEFNIDLPPLSVQKEIVEADRLLKRRIALNERMIQKLEATAQALYRKMFVDNIDKENLPDGWRMGSFTEVIDICGGGTPSTEEIEYWKEGKIPFYSPGDKTTFYYSLKTEKRITEKGLAHCSSKLYPKNTTFVTARGATTGGLTLSGCPMAMNQTCYAFVDKEKQNPFYVHQLALDTMASLKNEAVGATFEALVTKDFENTGIIIVPKELRNAFNRETTIIYNIILLKQQENLKLAELQSLLLAKMGRSTSGRL